MIRFTAEQQETLKKELKGIAVECPTFVDWLEHLAATVPLGDELPHNVHRKAGEREAYLSLVMRIYNEVESK